MSITSNLQEVWHAVEAATEQARRDPSSVSVLAVSKTFGPEAVIEAAGGGQVAFGENYLQEALDKQQAIQTLRPDLALEWHFIGPIQSNKTRPIAEHFAWAHAVDREKIACRLSEQRPPDLPPLNICLQVNVSGEASKSGISPEDLPALAKVVATLPNLRLRGLMAIPEFAEDFESQRKPFELMRSLQQQLAAMGIMTDTLSMGMSADMVAAIAEGATIVRIGTAIFGKRDYAK